MSWIESLENEFKEMLNTGNTSNATERDKKVETIVKKENVQFLWIGAIVLVLFTLYSYQNKMSSQYYSQQNDNVTPNVSQIPPWNNGNKFPGGSSIEDFETKPSLESKVEVLEIATRKIWERTKWTTDRQILQSIVSNNNSSVIKNNYPKSELIFLNSDWTINRMPTAINLDESDKEFLQKFIK